MALQGFLSAETQVGFMSKSLTHLARKAGGSRRKNKDG